MAAYGEDSSRSALTFMPPVTREMVSRPDRSVIWTKVSLKDAKIRATPKTSSPYAVVSSRWEEQVVVTNLAHLGPELHRLAEVGCANGNISDLDVFRGGTLDLLLGRHLDGRL